MLKIFINFQVEKNYHKVNNTNKFPKLIHYQKKALININPKKISLAISKYEEALTHYASAEIYYRTATAFQIFPGWKMPLKPIK